MYKTIYVPVDNSDHSNMALDVGVSLAKTFGSKLIGSHVYAAKMHDKRFKQMEAGLPEEYHDENELERQRQIHDSLITRGLQIITDSYLDIVDQKGAQANLPVERKSLEGRNFKVLVEDINSNAYDLVIMGALGVGAVKDSVIGGVTERVIRRVRASDMLVIKNTLPMNGGSIVVAVDGSHYSFGGLKTALALGKAFNKPVEAISAFDPYFHYAAFHSISGVLNEEAGKVFRFKEQEKLHEEIIDSGLAKIYQAHLDISREIAQAEGQDIKTTLLDGKAFDVYKFRSMYQGAEDETGPVWARDDDPRCTPIGKWLRRFDVDELPQLWNVFRGDMSIVGPRPERPHFVEEFKHRIPQYMLRHKVKAGMTGWAQVNGWRGDTALEKRIEYDLYYIENWSVRLDLKIMWLTIVKGFFHKHAY